MGLSSFMMKSVTSPHKLMLLLPLKVMQGKAGQEVIHTPIMGIIAKKGSAFLSPLMILDLGQRIRRLTLFISARMGY